MTVTVEYAYNSKEKKFKDTFPVQIPTDRMSEDYFITCMQHFSHLFQARVGLLYHLIYSGIVTVVFILCLVVCILLGFKIYLILVGVLVLLSLGYGNYYVFASVREAAIMRVIEACKTENEKRPGLFWEFAPVTAKELLVASLLCRPGKTSKIIISMKVADEDLLEIPAAEEIIQTEQVEEAAKAVESQVKPKKKSSKTKDQANKKSSKSKSKKSTEILVEEKTTKKKPSKEKAKKTKGKETIQEQSVTQAEVVSVPVPQKRTKDKNKKPLSPPKYSE